MPVIPAPVEHIQAALDAITEHLDHHATRIEAHKAEITALYELRAQYLDVRDGLKQRLPEPSTDVAPIPVIEPTFDEVIATMSGRIPTHQ